MSKLKLELVLLELIPLMFSQIALKESLGGVVPDDMTLLSSGGVAFGP